jgi:hypothetical protein
MAIEIVDLPTNNGDFLQLCTRLPEGSLLFYCSMALMNRQVHDNCRPTVDFLCQEDMDARINPDDPLVIKPSYENTC